MSFFNTLDPGSWIPATVVDVKDPEKKGRIKLRRLDQDEKNIPDDKLPWSYINDGKHGVTSGVGTFNVGAYKKGMWVYSTVDTSTNQITGIMSILTSPGKNEKFVTPAAIGKHEVLKDKPKEGKSELTGQEAPTPTETEEDTIKKPMKDAQNASKKTIGPQKFDPSQVIDYIKKFDGGNTSGAVQPALDIMKKLLNNQEGTNGLEGIIGSNLLGILQQILSMINNNKQQQPKPGDPCSIDEQPGTLQYVNNVLTCVPNASANNGR